MQTKAPGTADVPEWALTLQHTLCSAPSPALQTSMTALQVDLSGNTRLMLNWLWVSTVLRYSAANPAEGCWVLLPLGKDHLLI
jgi:hypothetical protein